MQGRPPCWRRWSSLYLFFELKNYWSHDCSREYRWELVSAESPLRNHQCIWQVCGLVLYSDCLVCVCVEDYTVRKISWKCSDVCGPPGFVFFFLFLKKNVENRLVCCQLWGLGNSISGVFHETKKQKSKKTKNRRWRKQLAKLCIAWTKIIGCVASSLRIANTIIESALK